jgi:hypothetical protein
LAADPRRGAGGRDRHGLDDSRRAEEAALQEPARSAGEVGAGLRADLTVEQGVFGMVVAIAGRSVLDYCDV